MQLRTLFLYLIGNRQAIFDIAASRWALPLGALFVFSAGLAREYDGEDLLHDPWYLLVPFAASLLASFLLFCLACGRYDWSYGSWAKFFPAYGSLLGLFWMTAPLAWLYAIPYERFLSPVEAVQANLSTLALVAVWRVLLMIRVLTVLLNYRLLDAILLVMMFAAWVVVLALFFSPFPIVEFMGGVRMSGSDRLLQKVSRVVLPISCCTGVLLFILIGYTFLPSNRPTWQPPPVNPAFRVSLPCWRVAMGSVAIWAAILPSTQPEQQLRHRIEEAYREGNYRTMLTEMSAHAQEEFPPHWQPPPRWPRDDWDKIVDIWEEILERPPARWVRLVYLDKLRELLRWEYLRLHFDLDGLRLLLARLPEGPTLLGELEREESPNLPYLRPDPAERKAPDNEEKK